MIPRVYLVLPGPYRASEAPKMSKRGTRGNKTLKFIRNLEQLRGLKEVIAKEKLLLHTMSDHQLYTT